MNYSHPVSTTQPWAKPLGLCWSILLWFVLLSKNFTQNVAWVRPVPSYAHSTKSLLTKLHLRLSSGKRVTSSRPFSISKPNSKRLEYAWSQWARLESFFGSGQVCLCHATTSVHVIICRTNSIQVCVIDGANGTEIQKRGGKAAETFSR